MVIQPDIKWRLTHEECECGHLRGSHMDTTISPKKGPNGVGLGACHFDSKCGCPQFIWKRTLE